MAGRAKWLAERQDKPVAEPKPVAEQRAQRSARGRGDHCRQHGTALLEVDAQGGRFRKPTCLECLPAHRPSCMQLEYIEKQSLWLSWQSDDLPDSVQTPVPSDAEFWDRFGWVPECRCPERRRALELKDPPPAMKPSAPTLPLNIGGKITAFTWCRLRSWLGPMLGHEMKSRAPLHWEVERLAAAADPIPRESLSKAEIAESARARARAILKRVAEYQLDGWTIT